MGFWAPLQKSEGIGWSMWDYVLIDLTGKQESTCHSEQVLDCGKAQTPKQNEHMGFEEPMMAQQLRKYTAFSEDPGSIPAHTIGSSQLAVAPFP